MLADLGVSGTPDEAREQMARLRDGFVDLPIVTVPKTGTALALDTINALAPE